MKDMVSAAERGRLDEVKEYLRKGVDVDEKEYDGETALIKASKEGHFDVVKYLIDKGADIDARNNSGESALMLASKEGHFDVVKYLLSRGADINARNKKGQTVLMLASSPYEEHFDLVKYLVDNGADVDAKDNEGKKTLDHIHYRSSKVRNYLEKKEKGRVAGAEFLKRLTWIAILGVLIMALSQYLVSSFNPIQVFYSEVSILYKIVISVMLCILIGVTINCLPWLVVLLRRKKKLNIVRGTSVPKIYRTKDDFSDELRAQPVARNRMDLLWLDGPRLEVIGASIGTQNTVFLDDGAGGVTQMNVTREDVEWAKKLSRICEKADAAGRLNDHAEAIRLYREALKLAPGCDMYLMSIGCSYANMGELKKGLAYLKRAAEISPGNERINRNLAEIRAKL